MWGVKAISRNRKGKVSVYKHIEEMRLEYRWARIIGEIFYYQRGNISSVVEKSKEVKGMETTLRGFRNLDMVLVVSPTVTFDLYKF